jgi:hypothetical protein
VVAGQCTAEAAAIIHDSVKDLTCVNNRVTVSADDFANHFKAKVDGFRAATECALPLDIMHRAVPRLCYFDPVTT